MASTTGEQKQVKTGSGQTADGQQKIQKLRELFADASEVGKKALENVIKELFAGFGTAAANRKRRPGRRPSGQGLGVDHHRSVRARRREAAAHVPAIAGRQLSPGAAKVGTLHDMRFVFLDNDTKLLFATAYDGDWDTYIDDFVAKIPDYLDLMDSAWEGWPGIRSPEAKDYLVKHQITAEGWYVANPDLTVAEMRRLKRVGKAVDEFLDKIG